MPESTRPAQDAWPAPQLRDCVHPFNWEPTDDPDWWLRTLFATIKPKAWQRVVAK